MDIDGTLTENGGGAVHLGALAKLRYLERLGYNVIFVTGRSSVEAYTLAVFGGTTKVAVGENGGCITSAPQVHKLLASKDKCIEGYEVLRKTIGGVEMKPVFPRMTEVVLQRTFDIDSAQKILDERRLNLHLSDSLYAFHINERGINKGSGLAHALEMLKVDPKEAVAIGDSATDIPMYRVCGISIALGHTSVGVASEATHVVRGGAGTGLSEAIDYVASHFLGAKS